MVEAILHDKKKILPCAVLLEGEYGLDDLFVGVPAVLGRGGMEQVIELKLTAEEKAALDRSAEAVREPGRRAAQAADIRPGGDLPARSETRPPALPYLIPMRAIPRSPPLGRCWPRRGLPPGLGYPRAFPFLAARAGR